MGPGTEGRNPGKGNTSGRELLMMANITKYLYGPGIVPRVFHASSHNSVK